MSDPRPTVGPLTERVYDSLPELYRDADAVQDTGDSNYPLLRYLSLILDQLTPVEQLRARLTFTPLDERDTIESGRPFGLPAPWQRYGSGSYGTGTYGDGDVSDLVDPFTADPAWLPWLAQITGVPIAALTVAQQRAAIANAPDAWAHGTTPALTRKRPGGPGYIDTVPHYDGPYVTAVVTKASETPASTFAILKASAPTWADLEALGSYSNAQAADVMATAAAEKPAGFRLVHRYLEDL